MLTMRLVLVLLSLLAPWPAAADETAAWAALREGGRVVLIRHGATSGGAGDPPGFRLADCATQRNLTEGGRAQARALGAAFRAREIRVDKVLSSEWCRCRETAELMGLGAIESAPTFNNAFILRDQRAALTEGARRVIAEWKGPGNLIVSSHGANILPLTGVHPQEGEAVVVDPASTGETVRVIGRIPAPRS
ncbi:MAG TPA: histidine phosphatase family protein [Longimicrobiales bacterium]